MCVVYLEFLGDYTCDPMYVTILDLLKGEIIHHQKTQPHATCPHWSPQPESSDRSPRYSRIHGNKCPAKRKVRCEFEIWKIGERKRLKQKHTHRVYVWYIYLQINMKINQMYVNTLSSIIAPERPSQKENCLETINFQVLCWFQGGYTIHGSYRTYLTYC